MHTLEITVQRGSGDGWPVVVEQVASGGFLPERDEGILQLDQAQLLECNASPKDYGILLGKALFRDELRDSFVKAVSKSKDRLHVLLFVEAPDLRHMHWERLCAR
jgi:hypothetical protein